jgi:hypothetical protein
LAQEADYGGYALMVHIRIVEELADEGGKRKDLSIEREVDYVVCRRLRGHGGGRGVAREHSEVFEDVVSVMGLG